MKQANHMHTGRGMSTPAYIAAVCFAVVVLTAGAVFIGRSDSGQINVSDTIKNASREQTDADGNVIEGEQNYTPPALRNQPNGGLVPQDPSGLPTTPQSEPESETTDSGDGEGAEAEDGAGAPSSESGTETPTEGEATPAGM